MKSRNKFARIHNQPRHGLSKKFIKNQVRTTYDIKVQLRDIAYSSCIERNPNIKPFGKMKGLTWWVMSGKETEDKKGIRRPVYVRAIQLLIEEQLGRPITPGELIHKLCKTKGCMNINHYEVQEKIMISREQARIFYETAITNGEARLPLNNAEAARKYRLCFYPHKTYWKQHEPEFWTTVDRFELVIRDGDVVCQQKGGDPLLQQAWARANLPTKSSTAERDEGIEAAMEELRNVRDSGVKPTDQANEVVKELWGNKEPEELNAGNIPLPSRNDLSYDIVYGKACMGAKLTEEEEKVLEAGPPPERREE